MLDIKPLSVTLFATKQSNKKQAEELNRHFFTTIADGQQAHGK